MNASRLAAAVAPLTVEAHKKEILALGRANAARGGLREADVFHDYLEMSAISLSNAVDKVQYEAREARYLQIASRYDTDQMTRFPAMLAHLVQALELERADVLGSLYMQLDLGDAWRGQFFTPYPVCRLLAEIALCEVTPATLAERGGFITLQEPAAGAGGMVVAAAEALRETGINPQAALCVNAIDIAAPCVWMTYVQLALLHIPACVVHGNALSDEVRSRWYTPAYVLGAWHHRLQRRARELPALAPLPPVALPTTEPISAVAADPATRERPTGASAPQLTLF